MIIAFWLMIAALTLGALGFILFPLVRQRFTATSDSHQVALTLYQQQLQDLTRQHARNELSSESYQQLIIELQQTLLTESVPSPQQPLTQSRAHSIWIIVLGVVILPLVAVLLYYKLGASGAWTQQVLAQQHEAQIRKEIAQLGGLEQIITQLKLRVEQNQDSHGWYLLGRLYVKAQRYNEAVAAFARADQLKPQQLEVILAYAQARYAQHDGVLDPLAKRLLAQALALQPNQPDALNLLAVDAYRQGHYDQAIAYWQQLLPQFPAGSDMESLLLQQIATAQQQQGAPHAQIALPVTVRLASQLADGVPRDASVFVYAQAVHGPPMPVAVVRRTVADLPLHITLDDSMAMMPGMSLSTVARVKVVARISTSHQPLPSPGDLIGSSAVIDVHHLPGKITIVIDRRFGGS